MVSKKSKTCFSLSLSEKASYSHATVNKPRAIINEIKLPDVEIIHEIREVVSVHTVSTALSMHTHSVFKGSLLKLFSSIRKV